MCFILQPWQFRFTVLASWVCREQKKTIGFYQAELEALMKAQGNKRLLLTDDQRRLLAVKGKFGEKMLCTAIGQFLEDYYPQRNHQGLAHQIIEPGEEIGRSEGDVQSRERLGGLLR